MNAAPFVFGDERHERVDLEVICYVVEHFTVPTTLPTVPSSSPFKPHLNQDGTSGAAEAQRPEVPDVRLVVGRLLVRSPGMRAGPARWRRK